MNDKITRNIILIVGSVIITSMIVASFITDAKKLREKYRSSEEITQTSNNYNSTPQKNDLSKLTINQLEIKLRIIPLNFVTLAFWLETDDYDLYEQKVNEVINDIYHITESLDDLTSSESVLLFNICKHLEEANANTIYKDIEKYDNFVTNYIKRLKKAKKEEFYAKKKNNIK